MDPRVEEVRAELKAYPDFPKKGILYRDIMPIFRKPNVFRKVVDLFAEHVRKSAATVHTIAGIEARGFLLGPPLALALNVPFVPIRKAGKLPGNVKSQAYDLEYGQDKMEVQIESVPPGKNIVLIDDLLATGGSLQAAINLIRAAGGNVALCLVVVELEDLRAVRS
uniref:Adenine phosphoribosyltransferase n=1 Tax=Amblyomma tuberculatum TaxID=48802 RepID=A0A6M2E8I5_9ACAR